MRGIINGIIVSIILWLILMSLVFAQEYSTYDEVFWKFESVFIEHDKTCQISIFPSWSKYIIYSRQEVEDAWEEAEQEMSDAEENYSTRFPDGTLQGRCIKYSLLMTGKLYNKLPGIPVLQISGRNVVDAPTGGHRFIMVLTDEGIYTDENDALLDKYNYFIGGSL
jgi:hypothetical protein